MFRYCLAFVLFLTSFCSVEGAAPQRKKKSAQPKYYLSAALLFRSEANYLAEWVHYHEMLGVEHFYLYNNLSDDHCKEVLKPFIDRGVVELIDWPYEHADLMEFYAIQMKAYTNAFERAKGVSEWLAVFDSDEFIVPNQHASISEMLRSLEKQDPKGNIAAYRIRWVVFGTSGVKTIPEGNLLIELLTKHETTPHKYSKNISKPAYVKYVGDAHKAKLKKHKEMKQLDVSTAQINHYMYRDQTFFETVKIPRVQKRGDSIEQLRESEANANISDIYSDSIKRFIPALKKKMGLEN
jgi:hypothetical protein